MATTKKKRGFDCLKMKEEIQARIHAETKDMSPAERLAYFRIPPEKSIFRQRTNTRRTDTNAVPPPPAKKKKGFDCVEMKNAIQAKIYAETKDMSFEELRARLNSRLQHDPFWQRISRNAANTASASAHTGNADILSAQCPTAFQPVPPQPRSTSNNQQLTHA